MAAPISTDLVERARALAAADPAHETCGLLLGQHGRIETLTACANVADDPRTRFEIDTAALIAAHRAARAGGPAVLGCWHSHPNGVATPSRHDVMAAQAGHYWLIVTHREARLFVRDLNNFREVPLDACASPPCLAGDPSP